MGPVSVPDMKIYNTVYLIKTSVVELHHFDAAANKFLMRPSAPSLLYVATILKTWKMYR
jgi:hypothetical protein